MARFAVEQYCSPQGSNLKNLYMHLTNYAINKDHEDYEEGDSSNCGHKRYLSYILEYFEENEGPNKIWENIKDIINKALITVQPSLSHAYRTCRPHDVENSQCFEVLGFDIMIDKKLRPWLLEVNHSPSFYTDSELDYDLKLALMTDTIKMLNLTPMRKAKYKRNKQKELNDRMLGKHKNAHNSISDKEARRQKAAKKRYKYEEKHCGNYELMYPTNNEEDMARYARYAEEAMKIWEKFTGSKKPVVKPETPKLKKKLQKGSSSSITTSTRATKKSSVRLSAGRPAHARDKSTKIQVRQIKKIPSERIELECKDSHITSLK